MGQDMKQNGNCEANAKNLMSEPNEIYCCNEHKHARRRNKDTCPDDQRC